MSKPIALSKAVYNTSAQLYVTFHMVVTAVTSSHNEVCSRSTEDTVWQINAVKWSEENNTYVLTAKIQLVTSRVMEIILVQNLSPAVYLNSTEAENIISTFSQTVF